MGRRPKKSLAGGSAAGNLQLLLSLFAFFFGEIKGREPFLRFGKAVGRSQIQKDEEARPQARRAKAAAFALVSKRRNPEKREKPLRSKGFS